MVFFLRITWNFKQFFKQLTFLNFSQLIIKVNLHRLLATYQKYFDTLFFDTIKAMDQSDHVTKLYINSFM